MNINMLKIKTALAGILLATVAAAPAVQAETITMQIGYSAGGGYDRNGRLVARHIVNFLPGDMNSVVQNVPGGGSMKLTKQTIAAAVGDDIVISTVNATMALAPLFDPDNADFDPADLVWIGSLSRSPSLCAATKESGITTMEQFVSDEFLVGSTGKSSLTYIYPAVFKNALEANYKVVTGFKGSSGIVAAALRGEVQGRCAWSYPSYMTSGSKDKFNVIGSIGVNASEETMDLPNFLDLIEDPADRAAADLVFATQAYYFPFFVPPSTSAETVTMLREAFMKMAFDPAFIEEALSTGLIVDATNGAQIVSEIAALVENASPEIIARASELTK